jgi:Fe-Mn family superoxide dismutase
VKKAIDHNLLNRITTTYGSFEEFKKQFTDMALSHFGSGWMWLVENKEKKLEMYSTPNQDSPYLSGSKPILALDLWEHAYYLKYQNRKADYITAWWKVVKIL